MPVDKERIAELARRVNRMGKIDVVNRLKKNRYATGGDTNAGAPGMPIGGYAPQPQNPLPNELVPYVPMKIGDHGIDASGNIFIQGFSNITPLIERGNWLLYKEDSANPDYKYYKNNDTGEYFKLTESLNPSLNLENYTEVPYSDIRKALPKKDYIGGKNYRLDTVKRVPGLLEMIKSKSDAYGIDPNLMLHRFMKEGIVDQWVQEYNGSTDAADQKNFFNGLLDRGVAGYGSLGLDDAGSNLLQGLYSLKDPNARWEESDHINEQGRKVKSIITPDMNSALEIKAADMAYRQRELAKRGLTGNNYVNAAYNMGLYNKKLNDPNYIEANYTVPNYGVFANGGKFIRAPKYNNGTTRFLELLDDYASMLYQPYEPSVPEVRAPIRYEPQPHYGLYEYPTSTGMAEGFPITTPGLVAAPAVTRPEEVVEDLFSEEAMARRALKQRYAESNFDNRAKSHAGAMGAWQIMPITYKDYLGRGRGKAGDLNDPEYNRKVRDWVIGIIPRDLQDLYSENDAPRVKLAKIYGAYNWGAGNMRKYLRKQREAGVDISNDTAWVEGLNPETKRYIKYLALDEDIPDSTYTNRAFEEAAAKRGYMNGGGLIRRFDDGGDKFQLGDLSGGLYPLIPTEQGEDIVLPYTAEGIKEKRFYDDPSNKKTHRVSAGETAWGISQQAGVPLQTLLKMNPDIGDGSLIKPGQELMLGYKPYPANGEKYGDKVSASTLTYKVQKGDYLGKIAKDNGLTLKQLLKINPQFAGRENAIAIGETVNLGEAKQKREFKTMRERREWERGLDDVSAIQNYKHDKNYAIVDKERQTMTVYSPDNKIVRIVHVNTGSSNDDFNTRTYSDDKGHILYGQGNMSTPAGITEIVSIGKDYGHKSYVRARVGSDGKVRTVKDENGNTIADTIASSMHYEKGLFGPNSSNGCIRMSGADADSLSDVLGVGSRVYTLPQRKDENGDSLSRFKLEDGKLSFYSDDPVGRTDNNGLDPVPVYEKGRPKKDKNGNVVYRDFASEDDYNLTRDMTAAPLFSNYSGDSEAETELERNRAAFVNTLADEKQSIMSDLIANKIGLNSDTYNRLAELSVALAAQESEFGTGKKFRLKAAFPGAVRALKGENGALSVGVTQMKYAGYNDEVRKIMRRMRINTSIDTDNQKDIENSARATMVLLAYMYNNQLTPSHRRKLKEAGMSEEEALAMMFNGRSVKELEELVSDKNWREKLITVSKYPGGIGRNLPFSFGTKEVLAADYANKVNKYLQKNEPFHYSFGGLLDKLGSVYGNDRARMLDAIKKIRQK